MRKIFSMVALMMLCVISAFAQDNDQNAKKGVCVDEFTFNSSIGTNWVTNLRNNVMEGILKTGRVQVIDITTLKDLPTEEQDRLAKIKELGVDVLLQGHYNSLDCQAKTKDGKTHYETASDFNLTLKNVETGEVISTQNFKNTWYSGETSQESITSALKEAIDDMRKFIDNNFKMEAIIKALDQVHPKKGARTVYITVGSDAGVQVGGGLLDTALNAGASGASIFDVYQEVKIVDQIATKQIGTLKAKEVMGANLTLCTVTKGGVEIQKAFEQNIKLIVVSRAAKPLF